MPSLIREYGPGDETAIVELSNRSFAPYAGWVPRTVEYWRWAVLARPGVDARNLLVLEADDKIQGYAALSEDGRVLDFLVDPDQRPRRRAAIAKKLVCELEERARARHFDTLTFSLPESDRAVDEALRETGYVAERGNFFSLGILNPQVLLQQLLMAREAQLRALHLRTFVFELTPGQYPLLLASRLLVQLDPAVRVDDISATTDCPGDCVIRIDLCTLSELVFCRASVNALLEHSELQIIPASTITEARALLNALIVDADWHIPRSDGF
jgi:ribosomal protein S18 acetylase RimI-like enzyme